MGGIVLTCGTPCFFFLRLDLTSRKSTYGPKSSSKAIFLFSRICSCHLYRLSVVIMIRCRMILIEWMQSVVLCHGIFDLESKAVVLLFLTCKAVVLLYFLQTFRKFDFIWYKYGTEGWSMIIGMLCPVNPVLLESLVWHHPVPWLSLILFSAVRLPSGVKIMSNDSMSLITTVRWSTNNSLLVWPINLTRLISEH